MSRGKRYLQNEKLVDRSKTLELTEAVAVLKKFVPAKFDETVELAIKLGVDPKQSEQAVRGTVILPRGTGKKVRVAVFCQGEDVNVAREAGADFIGAKDLIDKVSGGWLDFDVAVATPGMMKDLSKLGRVLGPRGLMPNPKAGTVTQDLTRTLAEIKAGKVEFKMDKTAVVHVNVGKFSFAADALVENIRAVLEAIDHSRPASAKGDFVRSIYLSSTMGPSLAVAMGKRATGKDA